MKIQLLCLLSALGACKPTSSDERQGGVQDQAKAAVGAADDLSLTTGTTCGSPFTAAHLQQCINNTTSGGTLYLAQGSTYTLEAQIILNHPITIFGSAKASDPQCYSGAGPNAARSAPCAILRAANTYVQPPNTGGLIYMHPASTTTTVDSVVLDHIVIDGNYVGRAATHNLNTICTIDYFDAVNAPGKASCQNLFVDSCNMGPGNASQPDDFKTLPPYKNYTLANAAKHCGMLNGASINGVGMGSVVVQQSFYFNFIGNAIVASGRWVNPPAGYRIGGSDAFTTSFFVDGLNVSYNWILDFTDGGISINGGLKGGTITGNYIQNTNDSAGNGMVLADGNWWWSSYSGQYRSDEYTNTFVTNNTINGCGGASCNGFNAHSQAGGTNPGSNSYLTNGINIGGLNWGIPGANLDPGDINISGLALLNNTITNVPHGIQLNGVGYPANSGRLATTIKGNNISNIKLDGYGGSREIHSPATYCQDASCKVRLYMWRPSASIVWCQGGSAQFCPTPRDNLGTVVGLTDPNPHYCGANTCTSNANGSINNDPGVPLNVTSWYFP